MKYGVHKVTKAVTVELSKDESEKLGKLLNRISNRAPNPKDEPSENLYRMLVEVLDL